MPRELIPILIVFIVVGLPIICGTLVKLAKIMRGDSADGKSTPRSRKKGNAEPDEVELLQQMHRSLTRLEERIDSLETIVLNAESHKSSSARRHE